MGTDEKDIPRLVKEFGGETGDYEDEKPRHTVSLPGFYLGRFPVTNAQFQAFVDVGGYDQPRYWTEAARAGAWKLEDGHGKVKGLERPRTYLPLQLRRVILPG